MMGRRLRRGKGFVMPGHDEPRALPLPFPQPHAGCIAVGELDARLFEQTLDGAEIVAVGHAAAFFEIDDDAAIESE